MSARVALIFAAIAFAATGVHQAVAATERSAPRAAVNKAGAVKPDGAIGRPAKEWTVTGWVGSKPLQLADLKGKVVLVRWFTSETCPYCKATAPALNEFHEAYAGRGLQVVGFYHHKGEGPMPAEAPAATAKTYGFGFPIAVDADWKTLRRWHLDGAERGWTSVTFLIDRKGVVRHIHPGGKYVKGDRGYIALKAKIEELLGEQ